MSIPANPALDPHSDCCLAGVHTEAGVSVCHDCCGVCGTYRAQYDSLVDSPYLRVDLGAVATPPRYLIAWSTHSHMYTWLLIGAYGDDISHAPVLVEGVRFCDRFDALRSAKAHHSRRRAADPAAHNSEATA